MSEYVQTAKRTDMTRQDHWRSHAAVQASGEIDDAKIAALLASMVRLLLNVSTTETFPRNSEGILAYLMVGARE